MSRPLHPGLARLLTLQSRSSLRDLTDLTRSPRGWLILTATGVLALLMIRVLLWPPDAQLSMIAARLGRLTPFAVLGLWLSHVFGMGQGPLMMLRGAELTWLAAAPISRGQLLHYKLALLLRQTLWLTPLMVPAMVQFGATRTGALLAAPLTISWVFIAAAAYRLMRLKLQQRIGIQGALAGESAVWTMVFALVAWHLHHQDSVNASLDALLTGPLGYTLLWPGWLVGQMLTSGLDAPLWLAWCGLQLAGLQLLLVTALSLGDHPMLTGVQDQGPTHAIRRSTASVSSSRDGSLPRRRLGGAAPLIRAGFVQALRGRDARRQVVGVAALCALMMATLGGVSEIEAVSQAGYYAGFGLSLVLIPLTLPQGLGIDFRGEAHRLPWLRSLPITSPALVFGVLAPTLAVVSGMQSLVVLMAMIWSPSLVAWTPPLALGTLMFSMLVIGTDNALVLATNRLRSREEDAAGDSHHAIIQLLGILISSTLVSLVGLFAVRVWWTYDNLDAAVAVAVIGLTALGSSAFASTIIAFEHQSKRV